MYVTKSSQSGLSSYPHLVPQNFFSLTFTATKTVVVFPILTFWSFFLLQDISCIKDLTLLYEAATIADIYLAYEQLKIDESSLYSCIGIAGAQAGEENSGKDRSRYSVF